MSFAECLSSYMEQLQLTAAELAARSGIAPSTISRYLHADQVPGEKNLEQLAHALAERADELQMAEPATQILHAFSEAASGISIDYPTCIRNLRTLLSALGVNNNQLARALFVDPSYISRILSGERHPSNLPAFLNDISAYLAKRFHDTPLQATIRDLTGDDMRNADPEHLASCIRQYLGQHAAPDEPHITGFLKKLDAFDLNEFMQSIHFEEIKVPTVPFQLPTVKTYTGLADMMQAELDFLKAAVLSHSKEEIILYSDMPMEEMSKDAAFTKKWMFGMAMLLRKGLRLSMIHDVHRPLSEMMLGLEGWIPMYMTGQVSPYYLKEPTNHTFLHFIRSAGSVAISGEAVFGHHANGRYVVTKNKDDVRYYRTRAKDLLHRALPLMKIYRKENADALLRQVKKETAKKGSYYVLSSAPPLFTMSKDLLEKILAHAALSAEEKRRILQHHKEQCAWALAPATASEWSVKLPKVQNEDFKRGLRLPIAALFPEAEVLYTKEEYHAHLTEARAFADAHPSFSISTGAHTAFRNIAITICPDRFVLVSKSNLPAIHFLIYHPKMIDAFVQYASH